MLFAVKLCGLVPLRHLFTDNDEATLFKCSLPHPLRMIRVHWMSKLYFYTLLCICSRWLNLLRSTHVCNWFFFFISNERFFLFSSVNISIKKSFYFMWMVYVFRWWTKFCFKYDWVSVKNVCYFRLLSCDIRSVDSRLTRIIYSCINPNKTVQKSVVTKETVFMTASNILFHLRVTKSLILDLLFNR